jgi:nucleotide-binding universal stress UspA family protein
MLGPGGRLTLVHVKSAVRLGEANVGWWNEAYEQRARDMFIRFTDVLPNTPGVTVETALLQGEPLAMLVRYASEQGVELLACGRRRHSLVERLLVGSVSTALVRRATCSVLVMPERPYDKELDDGAWITGISATRNPDEWPDFLRRFSQRNAGRRVELRVDRTRGEGAESLAPGYVLLGVDYDRRVGDERADIMLGEPETPGGHLTHGIAGLHAMQIVTDPEGRDTKLVLEAGSGRCTLAFTG